MRGVFESIYLPSAEAINRSMNMNLSSIAGLALNNVIAGDSGDDNNSKNRKNEKDSDEEDARGGKEIYEKGKRSCNE